MAIAAMAQARRVRTFICSLSSLDRGYGCLGLIGKRRRAARSGNSSGKRLQAGAQLGIGDFAQALTELLRHGAQLRAPQLDRGGRRLALPEDDPIDRRMTEEAVHPFDDE